MVERVVDQSDFEKTIPERLFHLVVESAPIGMIVVDERGNIALANSFCQKIFGYEPRELKGKSIEILVPQNLRKDHVAQRNQYLERPKQRPVNGRQDLLAMHKDGREIPVEIGLTPFESGGRNFVLASIVDNSEHKRIEQALTESTQRYRTLAETAQDAIFVINREYTIDYVNINGASWFGKQPDELIGQALSEIFPPDIDRRQKEALAQIFQTGSPVHSPNLPFDADQVRWLNTVLTPIKDEKGVVQSILGVSRDVTAQVSAEIQLKRRLGELEALHEGGLALSQTLDIEQCGVMVIKILEKHLDWHHAAVRLVKENSQELELIAFSRQSQKGADHESDQLRAKGAISRIGDGMSGWVIQNGGAILSGELAEDGRYHETFTGMRSGLYVPIFAGGRTIGCISAESEQPDAYNADDERLLTTVASQAGVAIENARLYKVAVRAAKQTEALYHAGQEMVRMIDDPEQIYSAAHRAVSQLMPTDAFNIDLLSEDSNELEAVYAHEDGQKRPHAKFNLEGSISGRIVKQGESLYFPDLLTGDFLGSRISTGKKVRSILGVPLRVGAKVIGTMLAECYQSAAYSQEDQSLMESLAAQTAISIENNRLFTDLRERAEEQTALYETTLDVSAQEDLHSLLKTISRRAASLLKADHGAVLLYDREHQDLINVANTIPEFIGLHQEHGEGLAGRVAQNRQPLIIEDYQKWDGRSPKFNSHKYSSVIGVPMLYQNEVVGVLMASNMHPNAGEGVDARRFTDADSHLLELFASAAAGAVYSRRLLEKTSARAGEFKTLYEITLEVTTSSQNLDTLLENIAARAASLLHAKRGGIYLYDPLTQTLELSYTLGFETVVGVKLKLGEGLAGRVAQTRQPMIIDDYSTWQGRSPKLSDQDFGPVLEVPMLYGQELIGVLVLNDTVESKRRFTEEDARVLSMLASAAAGAVYSTRLLEQTKARADEFRNLYEITKEVTTSGKNLETQLENIVLSAAALLHSSRGGIYLYDPQSNILELCYTLGFEMMAGIRIQMGEGLAGQVALRREAMIVDDYSAWEGRSNQFENQKIRAVLQVPMLYGQELIGVLVLDEYGDSTHKFTQEDARVLSLIATAAAGTIYSTRLHERTIRYSQQMESINALGRAMAESLNLVEIYERLAHASQDLVPGSSQVLISLFNSDSSMIQPVFGLQDGAPIDASKLQEHPLGVPDEGTQSRVIHSGKPYILDDLQAALKDSDGQEIFIGKGSKKMQSAIYVPMLAQGSVIGVLQMQSYTRSRFSQVDADLLTLAANTAAVAIENANLFSQLQRRVDQLSGLHAIDTAISSTTDLRMSLRTVLDNVTRLLKVDAADILLLNPTSLTLEHSASRGYRTNEITHTSLRFGEGRAGQAALERKVMIAENQKELSEDPTQKSLAAAEGFKAHVAVPLIAKGQVRGVLEIHNRIPLDPNHEWLEFLNMLSGEASLAVDSGQMFESLGRANLELTLAYDATIEGWSQALDLRDKETEGHTQRVTDLALELARRFEINPASLVHMRRGALLHDIGKMGIPDRILLKPEKLTEEEWEIMRRHPVYAHDLLSRISYLRPAMDIPACHHEKWDGSGYPNGLKGEQIPLTARIFSIVDVYDALTSDRPYRPAWTKKKALTYVQEQAGYHFDPTIVPVFLKMIKGSETSKSSVRPKQE